ncbi:MAG: polymer-forming cytoskeletal protein [Lachnospiraceae bacterium]
MSFFKDFKDDLSQAMNELLPGEEELKAVGTKRPEMVVNTLEQEVDVQSELKKYEGLFEKVDATQEKQPTRPVILATENNMDVSNRNQMEHIEEAQSNIDINESATKEMEYKEEIALSEETFMNEDNFTSEENMMDEDSTNARMSNGLSSEISDEVTVITEGTSLKGDLEATGSLELRGKIDGNVRCNGKVTVTGSIKGNAEASEFFADSAKIEGEILTTGTVKIGIGSVVVGNVTATSAVIAGAIKGDIDVQGPVVVDTSAVVMGNIKSRSVQINNGAIIEGFCSQCYAEMDMESVFGQK